MVWLIDNLRDLGVSIAAYISDAVIAILMGLWYPFGLILSWIDYVVTYVYSAFVGLISALGVSSSLIYSFLSSSLTSLFPSSWVVVLLLGVSIVVVLRLYFFIKDISIAGFKI